MNANTKMVPAFRISEISAKVAQATKIAIKLGCAVPTMTDTGKREVRGYRSSGFEGGAISCPLFEAEWKVEFAEIAISGEAPVLAGWTFVAAIEHLATGTIVTSREGETLPTHYRERVSRCEHCQTRRQRSVTFVVRNVETAQMLQVGSSCLADFMGHADPKAILDFLTCLHELDTCEEGEEGYAARAPYVFTLVDVLERTALEIDANGWTPKSGNEIDGRIATAIRVENTYDGRGEAAPVITPELTARAKAARAWALSLATNGATLSDYEHNVVTIARAECISARQFGLACSILASFERSQAKVLAAKVAHKAEHFGAVKVRGTYTLTVERIIDLDGQYGTTHLHLFRDAEGRSAKWFASAKRLDVGTTYTVTGTVKAHETYKDQPTTMLTRCKAIEVAS